jgi:hypothetical protein
MLDKGVAGRGRGEEARTKPVVTPMVGVWSVLTVAGVGGGPVCAGPYVCLCVCVRGVQLQSRRFRGSFSRGQWSS